MIKFAKIALGLAGMLILTTVPAFPATILTFTGTVGGTYSGSGNTVSSSNFTVTSIQEQDIIVGVGTFTTTFAENFTINFNNATPTLTINGTSGVFGNLGSLYSAVTSLSLNNTGGSTLTETASSAVNGVTGVNTTFLQDLNLAATTTFKVGGGFTGSGGNMVSDSLTLSTANDELTLTPEPASVFLFGGGLLAMAAIARKRRSRTV